jgi:hypothetical protein
MSKEKFWVLCVSKMPRTKNAKVKIFCSEDVPAKGEELTILGQFESKERAEWVRGQFSDKRIIANWRNQLFIEYSNVYPNFR